MDFSNLPDRELAQLIRLGNVHVFKFVYEKYWERLLYAASKRLGSSAEGEEIIQDIFLMLWKNREKFELRDDFNRYFSVAVKFQVIKSRAKKFRRANIDEKIAAESQSAQVSQSNEAWTLYDLEVLQKRLGFVIENLPEKCRIVFLMSRNDHRTNKEIAQELEISEKAVEKHITKALKELKAKFGHYLILLLILNRLI